MTSFLERRDQVRAGLLTGEAWAWFHAPGWRSTAGCCSSGPGSLPKRAAEASAKTRHCPSPVTQARGDIGIGWFQPGRLGRAGAADLGPDGRDRTANPEGDRAPGYSQGARRTPWPPRSWCSRCRRPLAVPYAELHCHSTRSFGRGGQRPRGGLIEGGPAEAERYSGRAPMLATKEDFENYRRATIEAFEEKFTALFTSSEFSEVYGKAFWQQLNVSRVMQNIVEKNFKILNLPTRSEVDEMLKDIVELKRTVRDMKRRVEAWDDQARIST